MTHADELKSSGLKATLPRIKILEVFQKTAQRHMTAEDRVQGAAGRRIGRRAWRRSTAC
jgi:Fe2+ or Zn2+ uptake regulation protein